MRRRSIHTIAYAAIVLMVVFAVHGSVAGQSGRRLPKGSPPVATSAPEPEPVIVSKPPPEPQFTFKVMSDISQGGAQTFMMPTRMHTWVVDRFRRSVLLAVRDGGSTGRSSAIKQAKAETEAFVVLLELNSDPFGQMRSTSAAESSVVVTVYHPVSGKVKFSRMMTVGQTSSRRPGSSTVLQSCFPGVYRNDLLLLETSIAAADMVLNSFNIPLPPVCGGTSRLPI